MKVKRANVSVRSSSSVKTGRAGWCTSIRLPRGRPLSSSSTTSSSTCELPLRRRLVSSLRSQISRLVSVCRQAKDGDGPLSHGSTRHASEAALQHHARGQARHRESQAKYEHVRNLSLMFAINSASTLSCFGFFFYPSLFRVSPEWSMTWT